MPRRIRGKRGICPAVRQHSDANRPGWRYERCDAPSVTTDWLRRIGAPPVQATVCRRHAGDNGYLWQPHIVTP